MCDYFISGTGFIDGFSSFIFYGTPKNNKKNHDKTTLTAAITKYLAEKNHCYKYVSYNEIDKASEEKVRGIPINISHISYQTEKRKYARTDCPVQLDFIKKMISGLSQMDRAIVIVADTDDPVP